MLSDLGHMGSAIAAYKLRWLHATIGLYSGKCNYKSFVFNAISNLEADSVYSVRIVFPIFNKIFILYAKYV